MSYDLYTSLLKMHDAFRPTDEGVHLTIDCTAPELAALREQHGLGAIAGCGAAFDRAVRVMDWLTAHVRHNGMCNPEGPRCAMTALSYAFDQPDRGVNCAWLATTLTECLLSLGIPARTVYIMPFAPYDCDNHVVTEVWDDGWSLLDPTCNCFVRDGAGHPLSVFGLRAAFANQQEVAFSEGLRYNMQPYKAEDHRDYLAKDLFWFRIAERTGFGDTGRFVTIAPEGFDPHRHEVLNVQYRLRVQGDQPWLRQWLEQLERKGGHLFCSAEDAQKAPEVHHG